MNMTIEAEKRDAALDLLAEYRKELIVVAKEIALELVNKNGTVTSPDVVRVMRERNVQRINDVGTRFMGVVFRKGWTRVGFVPKGSHCQPISVWKLK